MNKQEIIQEIRNLDVIERLDIITDIWDEIKDSEKTEVISHNEKEILLKRLARYKNNPDSAVDWETLKGAVYK
jgi:putative addiction module component (TIGR02574 family)